MFAPNDIGYACLRFLCNPLLDRSKGSLFLMQLFIETCNEMGCQFVAISVQFRDDSLELFGTTMGSVHEPVGPKIS